MKTVVKETVSVYLFDDSVYLSLSDDMMVVGDPVEFYVSDCNLSNSVVYEGVTAPSDWTGGKYLFDGADWTLNPKWVDPTAEEEEPTV